jgi:hypothetical protein
MKTSLESLAAMCETTSAKILTIDESHAMPSVRWEPAQRPEFKSCADARESEDDPASWQQLLARQPNADAPSFC